VVPTGARSIGNPVRVTEELETLQERFCEAVQSGRPVIATYSWIYGRVFGSVPLPWSQGHARTISTVLPPVASSKRHEERYAPPMIAALFVEFAAAGRQNHQLAKTQEMLENLQFAMHRVDA
jgi:hypothetical protein